MKEVLIVLVSALVIATAFLPPASGSHIVTATSQADTDNAVLTSGAGVPEMDAAMNPPLFTEWASP